MGATSVEADFGRARGEEPLAREDQVQKANPFVSENQGMVFTADGEDLGDWVTVKNRRKSWGAKESCVDKEGWR